MHNSKIPSHFSIEKTGLATLTFGLLMVLGTQPASVAQAVQQNNNQQSAPGQPKTEMLPL